ncbi:MAG: hypothetical protein IT442_15750 [Phycisphaeraceae bacterium]|nr:hypothetical protein [Phycisphaeraceae bacterium]
MNILIIGLVLWLVCAVVSYLLVRREFRGPNGSWKQVDRVYWGIWALVAGPIALVSLVIAMLAFKISNTAWAKREARW